MNLFGAMNTAITGLAAQASAFGNISDNIANSQTVGFKGTETTFIDAGGQLCVSWQDGSNDCDLRAVSGRSSIGRSGLFLEVSDNGGLDFFTDFNLGPATGLFYGVLP